MLKKIMSYKMEGASSFYKCFGTTRPIKDWSPVIQNLLHNNTLDVMVYSACTDISRQGVRLTRNPQCLVPEQA